MFKITIDPGHDHQSNVSPTDSKYIEGVQMFKLAGYLATELRAYGIDVEITRKAITDNPTLSSRGKLAGTNNSDLFISLHSNAPGTRKDGTVDTTITGTCIYYSLTDAGNKALADKLGAVISSAMGHKYRGSMTRAYSTARPDRDYYGVIRSAAENGCKAAYLIEHGFHTCPADIAYLMSDSNLKTLAKAEADVIAAHFGIENVSRYVVVGTKIAKNTAEFTTAKNQLKAMGYSVTTAEI